METDKKETQYFRTVHAAYEKIIDRKMEIDAAWHSVALEHINNVKS